MKTPVPKALSLYNIDSIIISWSWDVKSIQHNVDLQTTGLAKFFVFFIIISEPLPTYN